MDSDKLKAALEAYQSGSQSPLTEGALYAPERKPLDLDAIEARIKSTTPGPWKKDLDQWYSPLVVHSDWKRSGDNGYPVADFLHDGNAAFVAHARTDVPALVAEVRRLQALLETREVLTELDKAWKRIAELESAQ